MEDSDHLAGELEKLCHKVQQNGDTKFEIEQAFKSHRRSKPQQDEDDIICGVALTSYCSTVTNRLTTMLQQRNIKMVSPNNNKAIDEVREKTLRHEYPEHV